MEFTYQKTDNNKLFKDVTDSQNINVSVPQNYNPLYETFFTLSPKNSNLINLNHKHKLLHVNDKITNNIFLCDIDKNDNKTEVFFKYSPLIDPSKYIIGKYDINDPKLLELPTFENNTAIEKSNDPNNSAYVDGFFTYLTSQLLHNHQFVHATDFYGSFLAIKNDFECNVADDIEYLNDSDFFHKNNGTKFRIDSEHASNFFNFDTRQNKSRLSLSVPIDNCDIMELGDISDLHELSEMFDSSLEFVKKEETHVDLMFSCDLSGNVEDTSSSECSSRSSITQGDDDDDDNDDDNMDCSLSETDSGFSTASEDVMIATIPNFPVNVIALEKCEDTLDSLIVEKGKSFKDDEWCSIIIQIIMTLCAYQKTFHLTHNDLHTNNIMYVSTDEPFLYYKMGDSYYKVPTFGRIYKIIDYGRAIYKFRGNTICSDSYHKNGDAATQYNFEPYINKNKPIIEPNYSFDLCRLGCSMIDFFDEEISKDNKTQQLINEWCQDDNGKNVLYKKNGDERYPNFKLYKMIARTVHNHTPDRELSKKYFSRFRVTKKTLRTGNNIMNIDNLPCYALN